MSALGISSSVFKSILLVAILSASVSAQSKPATDTRPLTVAQPVDSRLTGGDAHSFSLAIQAGQYLSVVVDQKGIDVVVSFFDSDNKKLIEVDSPNGTQGPEPFSMIIETTGEYRIEIRSPEKNVPEGRYVLTIKELHVATDKETKIGLALKRYAEATKIRSEQTSESTRKAITMFEEAMEIYRSASDPGGEALMLNEIGLAYSDLGENARAIEINNRALPLLRALGDDNGVASVFMNTGLYYYYLGENAKAIEYYDQALPLFHKVGNQQGEATTLSNIGIAYNVLGQNAKAIEYYGRSLPMARALGDIATEARTLNNIGGLYNDLGDRLKALEYYQQALPLRRAAGDKAGEASTLNNIGAVFERQEEHVKALDNYNAALSLLRIVGDKRREASTLSNIGWVYQRSGDTAKAIEYYEKALPMQQSSGDKRGESTTLADLAEVYDLLGNKSRAVEYYGQSLLLSRFVGDKPGEGITLRALFNIFEKSNEPRLAIFYGKLSVNHLQILRSNVASLDKGTQKSFLRSVEKTYRKVADALIRSNRLAEAQQVLNALKDQQFFDLNQPKALTRISSTSRESALAASLDQKLDNASSTRRALDDFRRAIGDRQATDAEVKQIKSMEENVTAANDGYQALLSQAEQEFAVPADGKDETPLIPDLKQTQAVLRKLSVETKQDAVAIYQLVGEKAFHELIITPDGIKSVTTPINGTDLNEQAKQFWALLQTDKYDTTKVGQKLYSTVFKPIEKDLPKGTKTILWSLDGNLRYVPMAALHDGKQYLLERYNHVNFTRADPERLTQGIKLQWTATAFGSSKEKTVELLGEKIGFNPLPGVDGELKMLFRSKEKSSTGVFEGESFQDGKFTKASMLEALSKKRPVVHIASHFSFRPGDEARSFLLMGDGTAFTLDEMKNHTEMFTGVDLLTLSACNTAAQQSDGNGREVDAFFELAQRLGANSVLASLWPVADDSTPWLMREFYSGKLNKKLSKAESLRQAQLSLLRESHAKGLDRPNRDSYSSSDLVVLTEDGKRDAKSTRAEAFYVKASDAPRYKTDTRRPFAHPYYWSPFILFGNWQ